MMAFSMAALMFVGGVVVDLGSLYVYKSQLQNVADSAALAGVSQFGGTQFDTVSYRLVPSDTATGDSFDLTMGETTYNFVADDETDLADRGAEVYVDHNTSDEQKLSLSALKKEDEDTTKLWASEDSNGNVNAVCYLVKLKNTIPTYFTRFFGFDSLTPEATAVAMAYIDTDNKKIDEFIPEVAKNIAETIPNYYWESIVGNSFTVTNTDTSIMDFKIKTTETDPDTFGYRKSAYFTDSWGGYIVDITKEEDFTGNIIAYKDREPLETTNFDISILQSPADTYWVRLRKGNYINDVGSWPTSSNSRIPVATYKESTDTYTIAYSNNTKEKCILYDESDNAELLENQFCAEPIYADNGTSTSSLKNLVYTLNSELIQTKGTNGEITGLFLDRPNISSSKTVRGTVLNITSDVISNNNSTPLYMRFESEPIKFGGSPTFAQPITINVKGYQKKPMIIAYDGPDPNRTMQDVPKTDIKNPGGAWSHSTERILSTERLTTATVSAPYTVNLNADFNGVIYAPFSEITITGNGKINGFIMAARIIDKGTSSTRTKLTSNEISLPRWEAKHNSGNQFSYVVKYVTGKYSIVYDSLTYYTNSIVYKE